MLAIPTCVSDARLRRSLLGLAVLLVLSHLVLNIFAGPFVFTSAHGGGLYFHAAFLACIIVTISHDLLKMAFPFR